MEGLVSCGTANDGCVKEGSRDLGVSSVVAADTEPLNSRAGPPISSSTPTQLVVMYTFFTNHRHSIQTRAQYSRRSPISRQADRQTDRWMDDIK